MHAVLQIDCGNRRLMWVALSASLGAVAVSLAMLGFGALTPNYPSLLNSDSSADQALPLEIDPDPLSLGELRPGVPAGAQMVLRNPSARPVSVGGIETSCPCLRVRPVSMVIPPGESTVLTVEFDPTNNPDFRGGISITVIGVSEAGEKAFQTCVNFELRPENARVADKPARGDGRREGEERGTL